MGWASITNAFLKRNMLSVIACSLLLAGAGALVWPLAQTYRTKQQGQAQNAVRAQQVQKQVAQTASLDLHWSEPASLQFPRLQIALDILAGTYNKRTQAWTLDRSHAFYMQPTKNFSPGTPVIYAHSIPGVFRGLNGAAQDELLKVQTQDGRELWFRYSGDTAVNPTDSAALLRKVDNAIFIMTCAGGHFEQRRIMQFDYIGQGDVS